MTDSREMVFVVIVNYCASEDITPDLRLRKTREGAIDTMVELIVDYLGEGDADFLDREQKAFGWEGFDRRKDSVEGFVRAQVEDGLKERGYIEHSSDGKIITWSIEEKDVI